MCFASVDYLERPGFRRDRAQTVEVGKQQIGPLIRRGPTSETEGQYVYIHTGIRLPIDVLNEACLTCVCLPHLLRRYAQCVAQVEVVLSPPWYVAVVELLKRFARPCGGVYTVGDRVNHVTREHEARHFAVFLCHAVDVVAQIECQIGHIQHPATAEDVSEFAYYVPAVENPGNEVEWKLVMPRRNRRVGGEDTSSRTVSISSGVIVSRPAFFTFSSRSSTVRRLA